MSSTPIDHLFEAIRAHDIAKVDAIVNEHPAVLSERNAQGVSPLTWAAYLGQQSIVEALRLRRGTPDFHEACIVGDEGAVHAALASGRDVNELAPDGFAPVALAAFFHQPRIVKVLVDAGADVNLRSKNAQGVAAIHAAVARADIPTLELLLLRGADPNLPQEKGFRPLHGAASVGSLACVALLLMFGADLDLASDDGELAADIARKKGHPFAEALNRRAARRTP